MAAKKVAVEEFQRDLPRFLYGSEVVHVVQGDRTIAVLSPFPERQIDWAAWDKAIAERDAAYAAAGITAEEMDEFLDEYFRERKLKKAG